MRMPPIFSISWKNAAAQSWNNEAYGSRRNTVYSWFMRQMNRRTPKKIIQLVPVCKRDMKAAQSGSRERHMLAKEENVGVYEAGL